METETKIAVVGIIIIVAISVSVLIMLNNYVEQLGQAICEERYGADYVNYYDGVLECSQLITNYDGIKIKIVED